MTSTLTKTVGCAVKIAHRGNTNGPCSRENMPLYVLAALAAGYDAEIDVWWKDGELWLGHDKPDHMVGENFLLKKKKWLWCHAKNIEALEHLFKMKMHCFFHDQDDCTLTSQGYIWTYPKNLVLTSRSIAVMPERVQDWDLANAYGVCTDFPDKY